MKVSLNWLKTEKYLNWPATLTLDHLEQQLPMSGFEIDGVEKIADDVVLDLSITANRGDCLSVRGICREIACLNNLPFEDWAPSFSQRDKKAESISHLISGIQVGLMPIDYADIVAKLSRQLQHKWLLAPANKRFIEIQAGSACSFYAGGFIHDIPTQKSTPAWITDRLQKAGIETINPIVDICNYVMLSLGQPLHAFAANAIQNVQVRFAEAGEKIEVLGGQKLNLLNNTLVIADHQGVQAVAGIIGGLASAVNADTTSIFLESAHFVPEAIVGRARQYGLQTEASQRFERGVDPALPLIALEYATQLILEHVGGKVGELYLEHGAALKPAKAIKLRAARIKRILGLAIDPAQVERILKALGMQVEKQNTGDWLVTPPSFRFDITLEVDLIEELARVNGYEKIPVNNPRIEQLAKAPALNLLQTPASILVNRGYREIISYSFVSENLQQQCFPGLPVVKLKNPLSSELAVMRTSLWPSLINTWQYNFNRKQTRAKFFEVGRTYHAQWDPNINSIAQTLMLAGLVTGSALPEQWGVKAVDADFFDIKADVEALINALGLGMKLRFVPANHAMLHGGQAAEIFLDEKSIGFIGKLHPALQQAFELPKSVYLFEVSLADLQSVELPKFQDISRFPAVRRDFAFLLSRDQAVADIISFVKTNLGDICKDVILFDVYQGKNMSVDQKSIAFGVILQDLQSTLSDETVNKLCEQLVQDLEKAFAMKLRT